MRLLFIKDATVISAIGVHSDAVTYTAPDGAETLPVDDAHPADVGWTCAEGEAGLVFAPPPPPPAPPVVRHVAVGSFFDRFGAEKWAVLADPSPVVQALVKDCSVRRFIDLDRLDLPAALDLLVKAGHKINAAAILAAPVLDSEKP